MTEIVADEMSTSLILAGLGAFLKTEAIFCLVVLRCCSLSRIPNAVPKLDQTDRQTNPISNMKWESHASDEIPVVSDGVVLRHRFNGALPVLPHKVVV